jgi:hypothetical protein
VLTFLTPESGNTDDLRTINAGVAGDVIILAPASGPNQTIRVRHKALAGGNIALADQRDRWLIQQEDMLRLVFNGSYWCEDVKYPPFLSFNYQNEWAEVASAATFQQLNMAAGTGGGAGALSNANDNEDIYVSQAIAAAAGTIGGRKSSTFNLVRRAHNPVFECVMKTYSDITNIRYWIGLCQAAPTNVDTLAASTAGFFFRYSTIAGDAGWTAICNDGAAQSAGALVAAIAPSTRYTFRIRVDDASGQAWFSVNEGPEVMVSSNLPAQSQDLGAAVLAITTGANLKAIAISRYGCRFSGLR